MGTAENHSNNKTEQSLKYTLYQTFWRMFRFNQGGLSMSMHNIDIKDLPMLNQKKRTGEHPRINLI